MSIIGSFRNAIGTDSLNDKKSLDELKKTLSSIKEIAEKTADKVEISGSERLDVPVKTGASAVLGFMTGVAKGKQEEVKELKVVREKVSKTVSKLETQVNKLRKNNRDVISPVTRAVMNNVGTVSAAAGGLVCIAGILTMPASLPYAAPILAFGLNAIGFGAFYEMFKRG